ncbi:MAG TPA: universal stress protein [Gaiellaceae bacterium]|nr:universal stress protein [Gaiellaceae bacterium]
MTTVVVSYDGSDADRDALELGRLLARAGASLELAYVRHAHEAERGRERLAEAEAEELLAAGAAALGDPELPRHVVLSGSTSEGLRELALGRGADLVLFGSEYRTARRHVDPQASARRLIDGGPVAVGLAPAGFALDPPDRLVQVAAVGEEGDDAALRTAESLARRFDASIARHANRDADLLVVASKPGAPSGRVTVGAAAEYVIELATCPVLVLARGVALDFGGAP